MPDLSLALAEDFPDDLKIPAQPEIPVAVENEIARETPDPGVISDKIIQREPGISSSTQAYASGLFRDAGIPVLAKKYSNYKDILTRQNETDSKTFTEPED